MDLKNYSLNKNPLKMSTKKILIASKENLKAKEITRNLFINLFNFFFPKKINDFDLFISAKEYKIDLRNIPKLIYFKEAKEEEDGLYCYFENWNENETKNTFAQLIFTKEINSYPPSEFLGKSKIANIDYEIYLKIIY